MLATIGNISIPVLAFFMSLHLVCSCQEHKKCTVEDRMSDSQATTLDEAYKQFTAKCLLIDSRLIQAGRTPVMVSTAKKMINPVTGMENTQELITGFLMLCRGLDAILMDSQNFN
jgi:hypothetical protein